MAKIGTPGVEYGHVEQPVGVGRLWSSLLRHCPCHRILLRANSPTAKYAVSWIKSIIARWSQLNVSLIVFKYQDHCKRQCPARLFLLILGETDLDITDRPCKEQTTAWSSRPLTVNLADGMRIEALLLPLKYSPRDRKMTHNVMRW